MKNYDHKKIEAKWQEFWDAHKIYTTPDAAPGKENFYLLVEFPYPSGNLHVGHWYAFAVPDILARTLRMQGKNVLFPIGFDAFGLPAENAAIKNKLNPRTWTYGNIEYMKKQMRSMGASFDWSREVVTCDPEYYKWTQWQFLKFFEKGLAYQKETAVNWCPKDKTVLANEQVIDGRCERCDSEVEQKLMLQWNLKITDYADRLADDLDSLHWPNQIKESQKNWIGRSSGAEIDFHIQYEGSENITRNYIILHSKSGNPDANFYPWLKTQLESRGHTVQVPALPMGSAPDIEAQADYVQKNCAFTEHTVLIGHSMGALVALRLLERGVKAEMVTLVGAPISGTFLDGRTHVPRQQFDAKKIRGNGTQFFLLYDTSDTIVPLSDGDMMVELTGGTLVKAKAERPHFKHGVEPEVLKYADATLCVFTTRPDTLYGATYLVLAPEHPWVTLALEHKTVLKNNDDVQRYVDNAKKKTERERLADQKDKTGVLLEGVYAINAATKEKIPLFVADYVLATYGTGAIMGVPAHDERDYDFAKKYNLPIRHVVMPVLPDPTNPHVPGKEVVHRTATISIVYDPKKDAYLTLKWKQQPWITYVTGGIEQGEDPVEAAKREITEETGYADVRLIRKLGGDAQSEFYAAHKGVNRVARNSMFLFELTNDTRREISPEEHALHDVEWVPAAQLPHIRIQHSERDLILERIRTGSDVYTGKGILCNSGEFDGMTVDEAARAITERFGRFKTTYKLRDWIVSRQRYWGVPIPIVHCKACGTVAVPESELPVVLPEIDDYLPGGDGKSPLANVREFVNTTCPSCGKPAARETDTLDTFVDSSWYFLRYTDPTNDTEFASREKQDEWMPVNLYSGGAEHTTMHLLYSRFWQKALYDLELVKDAEPYARRMNRSLIMGPDGQKMSKSRGNVVDPDEVVERLGADTVRMYLAFIGPYNEVASYPWNPDGVVGIRRFLERAGKVEEYVAPDDVESLNGPLHKALKKVGEDILALKFNTAISQLMIVLNAIEKQKKIGKRQWQLFLHMLAPFAPHLAEELWSACGFNESIHLRPWPNYIETYLVDDEITVAIQINGKTRGDVRVAADASKEDLEAAARDAVASRLQGKTIVRTIVVPSKLVNFVIRE